MIARPICDVGKSPGLPRADFQRSAIELKSGPENLGHRTKTTAVTAAFEEYVHKRRQQRILDLAGNIEYEPDYDYKRCGVGAGSPDPCAARSVASFG